MIYIPPDGDQANFDFIPYIPPNGDEANFDFSGTNVSVRDSEVYGIEDIDDEINSEVKGRGTIPSVRNYRILVKDENGDFIGEFEQFRNLNFGKRLNNYGTASFEVPIIDPKANDLVSLRRYTVWIYYQDNTGSYLVWSGEQAMRDGNLDNAGDNWCTIHCYTWLEQLSARFTRSERQFTQVDAGEMAWTLIDESQHEAVDDDLLLDPEDVINNTEIGTLAWDDLVNGLASDDDPLSVDLGDGGITNYLAFQFFPDLTPLPAGAIITGIKVEIEIAQDTGVGGNAIDTSVVLLSGVDQSIISDDLARGEEVELDPDIYTSYGGQNNLWNAELDAVDINTNGIYAAFSYTGEISILNVDHARMTIYYYTLEDNANYDFGITEGSIEATIDRDRTYYNQNIMEAIINLTNVLSGFDFEITDNKVFNVYSVMGTDQSDSLVLEYGVNVESAQVIEDFTTPVNKAIVLGQSTDDLNALVRVERNDGALQDDYKVREGVLSEMEVTDTITMEDKGDAMIRKYGTPLFKIDINLVKSTNITLLDFELGDLIRLIIQSGFYDINQGYRIFEWSVVFDDNNTEKLSLILGKFTI